MTDTKSAALAQALEALKMVDEAGAYYDRRSLRATIAAIRAAEAALAAPANQAHHVGDTKFEGWLSGHEPDRRDGRTPRYSKQDMRDSYWAGYSEASAAAPVAHCRDDGRCQYAIDHGAEGMGQCPKGKCAMPAPVAQCEASLCMQSNRCSYQPCRSGGEPEPAAQPTDEQIDAPELIACRQFARAVLALRGAA
jgi:hypothetical protein